MFNLKQHNLNFKNAPFCIWYYVSKLQKEFLPIEQRQENK